MLLSFDDGRPRFEFGSSYPGKLVVDVGDEGTTVNLFEGVFTEAGKRLDPIPTASFRFQIPKLGRYQVKTSRGHFAIKLTKAKTGVRLYLAHAPTVEQSDIALTGLKLKFGAKKRNRASPSIWDRLQAGD